MSQNNFLRIFMHFHNNFNLFYPLFFSMQSLLNIAWENGLLTNWRLRNESRNSILMSRHYPNLGSASDWLKQILQAARPMRNTTQIWVVSRHQYGISALVSQKSIRRETVEGVANVVYFLRLFERMSLLLVVINAIHSWNKYSA